ILGGCQPACTPRRRAWTTILRFICKRATVARPVAVVPMMCDPSSFQRKGSIEGWVASKMVQTPVGDFGGGAGLRAPRPAPPLEAARPLRKRGQVGYGFRAVARRRRGL